ncbi:4-alpha-glucanotransferase [Acuticoccus sp. MNP-M23]|uniref:4-alpha-glucanotransferase n=1 Tax=Acuticoccus sp. MNP-M23 TaxID=3072793 RepID=UPI0028166305|nr:4-alpha-glucanotransferase [Acuticoccus sp. MNP-M23]WMS40801.1 4-alpha-glucanotransferase [Acuticoccus sp. MNP-M23]
MSAGPALKARAEAAGILLEPRWGGAPDVPAATLEALVALLGEAAPQKPAEPRQAYVPPFLDSARIFGVALQLYQLRSPRNLGVGDLGDLQALIAPFAAAGADFIGLNPLHALFSAEPERASPFSPSDRCFLNPLIVAVDNVPGYDPAMREGIEVPDASEQVDYTAAAAAKLAILRKIFAVWQAGGRSVPDADREAAAAHRAIGGKPLADFALFEALSHAMVAKGHGAGWPAWPAAYRHIDSPEVAAFRAANADEVAFHTFLQFVAASQLDAAQAAAENAGMRLGLYLDLAVGTAPDGAATWADPALAMRGARVGAPPDLFSSEGQDWGLAPLSPTVLQERDFAPYRAVMGAVMGPAGAARIDHAMGIERLFLIPDDASALDGAYVKFPGLTDVLVDETHRHSAIAIGEDLGVVPEGFRERMGARRIFSMRIVPFERDATSMRAPARYPADSLACFSTHDIAPLEAWWRGDDIAIRRELGGLSAADMARATRDRQAEKALVLGLAGLPPALAAGDLTDDLVVAIHRIAARSGSRMVAIRLEDVVGGRRLVNLPGTDREHPNWRKTLPLDVAAIAQSARLARVFNAMAKVRTR